MMGQTIAVSNSGKAPTVQDEIEKALLKANRRKTPDCRLPAGRIPESMPEAGSLFPHRLRIKAGNFKRIELLFTAGYSGQRILPS